MGSSFVNLPCINLKTPATVEARDEVGGGAGADADQGYGAGVRHGSSSCGACPARGRGLGFVALVGQGLVHGARPYTVSMNGHVGSRPIGTCDRPARASQEPPARYALGVVPEIDVDTEITEQITQLLQRWHAGDREALDALMPRVYATLRALARQALAKGHAQTLDPTLLVHEAFLRVRPQLAGSFENRGHFFAVAAVAMRHIVIDEARRRRALRRGGDLQRVELDEGLIAVEPQADLLIALDQALERLGRLSPRLVQVVECRYFAGLTLEETAETLGVVRKTVQRDWLKAQALLRRDLGGQDPGDRGDRDRGDRERLNE